MKTLEEYHRCLPYRKSNDDSIGNLLVKVIELNGMKEKFSEYKVKRFWNSTMGEKIASLTNSIFLKNGKLFIQINSASLKQELTFGKDKIKKIVNEMLKEDYVTEVILL